MRRTKSVSVDAMSAAAAAPAAAAPGSAGGTLAGEYGAVPGVAAIEPPIELVDDPAPGMARAAVGALSVSTYDDRHCGHVGGR